MLRELVEDIMSARDEKALRRALARLATAYGYEHYAFINLHAARVHAVSDYPAEWQEEYLTRSYMIIDPVVTVAKRVVRPFDWSNDRERRLKPPEIKRFCDDATACGIRSGISLPVRTGRNAFAVLTFSSSRDSETAISREFDFTSAGEAVAFLHSKFAKMPTSFSAPQFSTLNERETTCLKWSAEGKSFSDIAAMEGLKYSTVRFHIENAKQKLLVQTVAHATALATRLGLI
jgi:LuxR family transcriptional activator of conjugal transfer of Ti plasmids